MSYIPKILIVDDVPRICDNLKTLLSEQGYEIKIANNGLQAMEYITEMVFDLALVELILPDIDGYHLIDFINYESSDASIIIITGYPSTDSAVKALKRGVCDYIRKPFEPEEILATVRNTLDKKRLINERKSALVDCEKTKEFLKNILDSSSAISIISTDLEQNVLFWNKGSEKIFGYKAEEIIGRQKIDILYPGEKEKKLAREIRSKILKDKKELSFEIRELTKDGHKLWINLNVIPRFNEEGHVVGILGIGEDITERKRAANALRESENRFRSLIEQSPLAIQLYNEKGLQIEVNKAFEKLWGIKREKTVGIFNILTEAGVKRSRLHPFVMRAYSGEAVLIPDMEFDPKILGYATSHPRWVRTHLYPIHIRNGVANNIVIMHEDVTERKRTEEQIIQSQRLESVATLAGGVAHQFNNALFGVIGNVDLLQMSLSDDVNLNKCVEGIKASAHRMAYLVNLLIAYAGRGKYRPEQISPGDFIEEILPLLKRNIDPTISLKTDLSRDIFKINADPTQIQMVLSSVLENASDATEGEGSIRISTRDEKIDEGFAKSRPGLKPGHYVRLSIEDEGKGMDEETKRKIFEPFFTTKFQGRGLGMSAAYGIVKNHDGWISVDSELGRGTTVHIYLPAIKVKINEEKEPKTEVAMGTGTILLIEDEEIVMDITQGMLERLGYRVLQARNGTEAVNLAKTFDGDIDLAILDIGLPDMGGEKLYPLLKKERPDLRVIICSGYSFEGPVQETLRAGAQSFLEKPYSFRTLAEKLQELLKLKNKQ